MGKYKNCNKHNYLPYNKKQNHSQNAHSGLLPIGIKGFICTFNTMKKQGKQQCMKEAYNILYEYYEKLNEPENESKNINDNRQIEDDIEDALDKELQDLKESAKDKKNVFEQIDSGASGNLFIKLNDNTVDAVKLGTSIIKDIFETKKQKTINLLRLIPIEITCKAYLDDISKIVEDQLIPKYFSKEPTSFCVILNKKNNNNIDKMKTIEMIALIIRTRNFLHRVDLKNSKLTIFIEIIKSTCCLSVLEDYHMYKKYNLLEITAAHETNDGDNVNETKSSNEEKNEEISGDNEETKCNSETNDKQ